MKAITIMVQNTQKISKFLFLCYIIVAGLLTACQTTDQVATTPKDQPEVLEAQKGILTAHLNSGQHQEAYKKLRQLLQIYPKDIDLQRLMGLTQLAMSNYEKSIIYFTAVYKASPTLPSALNLSSALIEGGQSAQAIKLLKEAIARKDEFKSYVYKERLYHNLGYAYLRANQKQEASIWFQKAIRENPTYFQSHLEMARLYEEKKQLQYAYQAYGKANTYCSTCFEAVQGMVRVLEKQNRKPLASRIVVQFMKTEGITANDRVRARQLLNNLGNTRNALKKRQTKGGPSF